MADLWTLADF